MRDEHILRINLLKISLKNSSHCSQERKKQGYMWALYWKRISGIGRDKKKTNNETVEMNVCFCHFHLGQYWGEEAANIENTLRDDGVWSAIRPLAECHRANGWERTLPMVDSTFLHHQHKICRMLHDFNVCTPSVRAQHQVIRGMLYSYIYFDTPICSP